MALALGGIALAYIIYGAKIIPSTVFARLFRPLHVLLENKYYADVLYEQIIVGFLFYGVLGNALATFDRVVVDGVVNGVGQLARSRRRRFALRPERAVSDLRGHRF